VKDKNAETAVAAVLRCECGKMAIKSSGAIALCVDCYYKLTVAETMALRLGAIAMNHAADQMDSISGLRNFTPKMQVPDLPKGPIILNNIKVANSVVGAINTGDIQTIDVSITYLKNAGNSNVSNALTSLTQTIVNEDSLSKVEKNHLLDQVAYLSEQAAHAAKDRKPGMIKAALGAITQGAATVSAVAGAWQAAEPLLKGHFGIL
jgi:hypothetical protein